MIIGLSDIGAVDPLIENPLKMGLSIAGLLDIKSIRWEAVGSESVRY